jgi:hypothetical protein
MDGLAHVMVENIERNHRQMWGIHFALALDLQGVL